MEENTILSQCLNITNSSAFKYCNLSVYYFYPRELLWFGAASSIFLSIVGTLGNFISIIALLKSKRLRNATTAFVVNLCLSDLLFCSFSMPLTAMTFIHRNWTNGDALCKLFAFIKYCNGIVSIFTVVAITLNRFVLIVHPKAYQSVYSKRNTALMIVFLWFLPCALLFLPLFNIWGTLGYDPNMGYCGIMNLNGKSPSNFIFFGSTVVPAILFLGCYLKIYFVVKKSVRKVSRVEVHAPAECQCVRQSAWYRKNSCSCKPSAIHVHFQKKKEFRLLRIVMTIFIIFVLSTFPLAFIKIYHKEYEFRVLNILGYVAFFSSNVVNPIIYIVMSEEYRRAYKELFVPSRSTGSVDDCIDK